MSGTAEGDFLIPKGIVPPVPQKAVRLGTIGIFSFKINPYRRYGVPSKDDS
jgi:hypothetical protein